MEWDQEIIPIVDVGNSGISVVLSDLQPITGSDFSFCCD